MRCIIVGDGPSAKGFVAPDGVAIFAVKRTIHWLNRADYWFSLDPNEASMECMLNQRPGVRYFCAVDPGDSVPAGVTRLERVASRGREPRPRACPEWWLWRWSGVCGLSETPGKISSGNSAWGALGLAYQLGYRDVLLVGVDGTQEMRRSDRRRPNNLSHLPILFRSAIGKVRMQTVGRMRGIPTTTLEAWLNENPRD